MKYSEYAGLIRKKLFAMVPDNRVISSGGPEISEFWKTDHECPVAGMVFRKG
jgi:hypothetical protein